MLFLFLQKNGIIIVKKKKAVVNCLFLFLKKGGVADAQEQSFNNNIRESEATVKIHE